AWGIGEAAGRGAGAGGRCRKFRRGSFMVAPLLSDSDEPAYGFILEARITFPQVSKSILARLANSSGALPTGSKASAAKRSCISGRVRTLAIALLSDVMISLGVLAGTRTPNQLSNSMSG